MNVRITDQSVEIPANSKLVDVVKFAERIGATLQSKGTSVYLVTANRIWIAINFTC